MVPSNLRAVQVQAGDRREGGRDLLAGSFLQLPQTARLSLGLVQAWALAGRGGVWQVLAGRSSTAAGPLRGGVSQVSIHQLHDLFHLREGRGQDAPGATGLSCLTLHPGSRPRPALSCPYNFSFLNITPSFKCAGHTSLFVLLQ